MKRTLAAILALALCLALCACGASAPAPTLEPTPNPGELLYNKYADIIDALEAEDYDGAVEAVEALRPAPEVTEVEITMDNLWDYFEIREIREENTDANGNTNKLKVNYEFALKAKYELANEDMYPTDVALGYEYSKHFKGYNVPCIVNYDDFTCDGTTWGEEDTNESNTAHYPKEPSLYFFYAVYDPNHWAQIITISDFETINASGTLYLVNK